jgi:hypothetical protein
MMGPWISHPPAISAGRDSGLAKSLRVHQPDVLDIQQIISKPRLSVRPGG